MSSVNTFEDIITANCSKNGCSKIATQVCSTCRSTFYCSRECQLQHWRATTGGHKQRCKELASSLLEEEKESDRSKPQLSVVSTIASFLSSSPSNASEGRKMSKCNNFEEEKETTSSATSSSSLPSFSATEVSTTLGIAGKVDKIISFILKTCIKDNKGRYALEFLKKILKNVIDYPEEEKYLVINYDTESFKAKNVIGIVDLLDCSGFKKDPETKKFKFQGQMDAINFVHEKLDNALTKLESASSLSSNPDSDPIPVEAPRFSFNKMKVKELIYLIDGRKLNRVGLQEKIELVQLLESNILKSEIRGVTLKLFKAISKLALSRNKTASFWSIGHVKALLVGDSEILKADGIIGYVDPTSTLTHGDRCSLIDILLAKHFDSTTKHPLLELSYKEAVGEKAAYFLSFAGTDNFFDLIDALEDFLKENKLSEDNTSFWFDAFVNDQWLELNKSFERVSDTRRAAITAIGHTLSFFSSWNDPSNVKQAWCLLDMRYSPQVTLICSQKEVAAFKIALRSGDHADRFSKGTPADPYNELLCRIKVENATSDVAEDSKLIFESIRSMEGGIDVLNNLVTSLLRKWISKVADTIICSEGDKDATLTLAQLQDLSTNADILYAQGKLEECALQLKRVLTGHERILGSEHPETLTTMYNLANTMYNSAKLNQTFRYSEAKAIYYRAMKGREKVHGPFDERTLNTYNAIGILLKNEGDLKGADEMYKKALSGYELSLGPKHHRTLLTVDNIGRLLQEEGKLSEAKMMHERALKGFEEVYGPDHPETLTGVENLAGLFARQGDFKQATSMYERVLKGREKNLGIEHPHTIRIRTTLNILRMRFI